MMDLTDTICIYSSPHSSDGDPHFGDRSGEEVHVIRPVPPESYDVEGVGPMWSVIFMKDGVTHEAFEDELTPIQKEK